MRRHDPASRSRKEGNRGMPQRPRIPGFRDRGRRRPPDGGGLHQPRHPADPARLSLAIDEYIRKGGKSRGSYLICGEEGLAADAGVCAAGGVPVELDEGAFSDRVCETALDAGTMQCSFEWKPVRPIPSNYDDWFENVYNAYVRGEIVK